MEKLTRSEKVFLNSFLSHGSGDAKVEMTPQELGLLALISYTDLHPETDLSNTGNDIKTLLEKSYYNLTPSDLENLTPLSLEESWTLLNEIGATNPSNIIYLYLKNLCDLHRRRIKYIRILQTQPFPTVDQIGPRSLLEYGVCNDELLFTWLHWRKWIYDIDNRSAQETGYLFEPILASSMGGESISHRHSPVKRADSNGDLTEKGRQIDCYLEEGSKKIAVELKLRVTIAASGQGRFAEELSFASDAQASGITPVLVVFDPTDSPLLQKLKEQYILHGGEVFVGEDAWDLIQSKAGNSMDKFVSKYIKPPIVTMASHPVGDPSPIKLFFDDKNLIIESDTEDKYIINRQIIF